jgi:hypothetical protein
MPIWESAGRVFHGWANWLVGDQQMELAEMRRGIERWRELEQIPVDFTHSLHA